VGKRQAGPSSYATVRSAGADLRLGGLQSGVLEHALGDMRGSRWLLLGPAGCASMVAGGHRGQRIRPVSSSYPLSNHAAQPTAGARRLEVNHSAVGGAPAAADGERYADRMTIGNDP